MASNEVLRRLQVQIDGLSQRMRYDANDLDYETHLQRKRELQRILDTLKRKGKQEGFS
ncbi:MAG: aminoglycoside phosphotransferase [Selenomonadaceae bacterium]|nr:aminoglycoside phosphotransferase [Selenomonadaceae bacterium]MBR6710705.1 aminoglycoside phosphotransferase [Selenomonadaceae bacterium]